jgi:hypothetical protein
MRGSSSADSGFKSYNTVCVYRAGAEEVIVLGLMLPVFAYMPHDTSICITYNLLDRLVLIALRKHV